MESIVSVYPVYYEIYKRYLKGQNIKKELDDLYRPLFKETIAPNYTELMLSVYKLDTMIEERYGTPDTIFCVLDYFEFIFSNVLYETFIYELDLLPDDALELYHLAAFKYIIFVELYKFAVYKRVVVELDIESVYLPAMVQRSYNCELKISFALKKLIEYSLKIKDNTFVNESKDLIKSHEAELRIKEVKNATSFIKLCKK
jgi:hypothetical protein